jgi:hypothetical protein
MLPVSLDRLFLIAPCFVCLRPVSCVPNVASFSGLSILDFPRIDNPEKLATLGTQDTGRRQTKQGAIKNRRSRDTGNIGNTRHKMKTNKTRGNQELTIQRNWQHWVHKTQGEDKQNKGQSRIDNPEKLATLGTQDTGRRQTKQGACPVSCVPNVASFSGLSILDCPLFCLSSSCVLCSQCCQFLWIVYS